MYGRSRIKIAMCHHCVSEFQYPSIVERVRPHSHSAFHAGGGLEFTTKLPVSYIQDEYGVVQSKGKNRSRRIPI